MNLFISVGTTQFDKLIELLDSQEIDQVFHKNGFEKIFYQKGNSQYQIKKLRNVEIVSGYQDYQEKLEKSDLMICHAGAGTILECMEKQIPIITVVNEDLVDNHQLEIFETLKSKDLIEGFSTLNQISPQSLNEKINRVLKKKISTYPFRQTSIIQELINQQ